MTVAELIVQCLEAEQVKYIFGVPGEENQDLLFALDQSKKIQFVPTRHEQGAAFIADVWGRLTGEAGVCLSTLGPGASNLMTGVADAFLDKAPLVAITGQGALDRLHHESHQYLDVVSMLRPITKWNDSIRSPEVTSEMVRKAFKLATLEKPGSTHFELPEDVARMETPSHLKPIAKANYRRAIAAESSIEECIRLLASRRRPVILAGNGAIRNRASRALTRFSDQFNIPVASTFMGKGAIPDYATQSLMAMGLGFKDFIYDAFRQSDLIITVGYDIAEYAPDHWNPDKDKTIIHIDFEQAEVYDHYAVEVEIAADIAATVDRIHDELERSSNNRFSDWYKPIRQQILNDLAGYQQEEGEQLNVPGALHILREVMNNQSIVISDVGSHKMWIARNFPTYCANGCIISNGLASMGISLPGGIAAKLAFPDRQVFCLMGDGGFLMNVQEIETARRLGVAFPIIVFRDDDYGLISWKQERDTGRSTGTKIGNPDLVKLAESFDIEGYRAKTAGEFKQILQAWIQRPRLALIDVPIDTSVNQELIEKLEKYYS